MALPSQHQKQASHSTGHEPSCGRLETKQSGCDGSASSKVSNCCNNRNTRNSDSRASTSRNVGVEGSVEKRGDCVRAKCLQSHEGTGNKGPGNRNFGHIDLCEAVSFMSVVSPTSVSDSGFDNTTNTATRCSEEQVGSVIVTGMEILKNTAPKTVSKIGPQKKRHVCLDEKARRRSNRMNHKCRTAIAKEMQRTAANLSKENEILRRENEILQQELAVLWREVLKQFRKMSGIKSSEALLP